MDIFRQKRRKGSAKTGAEAVAIADEWKKAEMAKIKDRYRKLIGTILSWEEKKRAKARRKLDRTESELERRRKQAPQKFKDKMEYTEQTAAGRRAEADERRRNEELKVKEKANIMRITGRAPSSCF